MSSEAGKKNQDQEETAELSDEQLEQASGGAIYIDFGDARPKVEELDPDPLVVIANREKKIGSSGMDG